MMASLELDCVDPNQRELLPKTDRHIDVSDASVRHHATPKAARPVWVQLTAKLLNRFLRRQEVAAARKRLRDLADEPEILEDVGMTRADALYESRK